MTEPWGTLVVCPTCDGDRWLPCPCDHCRLQPRRSHEMRCWECFGTGRIPEGTSLEEIARADMEVT